MRILVAGRQGQLAQALVEAATTRPGIELHAAGREAFDICDAASIERLFSHTNPDLVINAAAYTAVDKAEAEEDQAFAVNERGAGLLAEVAARRGAPIIQVSTDYVYDGTKPGPYVENDPVGPTGVYGRSKLAGEAAVRDANPKYLVMRTAWVHSPTGHNFVKTMLRLAADRDSLNVVDDQRGNPTYAPHLAVAILDSAKRLSEDRELEPWGVYHVAGEGTTTWCGLAREVFRRSRAAGGPAAEVNAIKTKDYPTPAQRPANSQLDCSKIKRVFGIEMPDWRAGVSECVARLMRA
jgi:dTDP-4-dehydrorhamnose reductase